MEENKDKGIEIKGKEDTSKETAVNVVKKEETPQLAQAPDTSNAVKKEDPPTVSWGSLGMKNLVALIFIMIMTSVCSIFVYDHFFAQKLTTFDLQGYLTKQRVALQTGQLTEQQVGDNLDAIKAKMDKLPLNQALITSDVVLRNIKVVTLE